MNHVLNRSKPFVLDNDDDLLALLALLSPEPPRPVDEPDDDDFHGLLAALSPAPPKLSPVDREPVAGIAEKDQLTNEHCGDAGPPILSAERQAMEEADADHTMSRTSDAATLRPASVDGSFPCEAVRRNDCAPHASAPEPETGFNCVSQACVTAGVTTSSAAQGSSPTIETIIPVTHTNVPTTTPEANASMAKAVDANTKVSTCSCGSA